MMGNPKHYGTYYERTLTQGELDSGVVKLHLDPYRMAGILNLGGGAREQIFKKASRWTSKGDSEEKVINEIIQACNRHLEMITEDTRDNLMVAPTVTGSTLTFTKEEYHDLHDLPPDVPLDQEGNP